MAAATAAELWAQAGNSGPMGQLSGGVAPSLPLQSWPGGSPENTAIIIGVIVGAYLSTLWIAAVVWTARDIRQRAADPVSQMLAVLLVVVFNLPGWVLYRVLRPPLTLSEEAERRIEDELLRGLKMAAPALSCSRCDCPVEVDYIACPNCGMGLKRVCAGCERALMPEWNACPWCSQRVHKLAFESPEPVRAASASGYSAPSPVYEETASAASVVGDRGDWDGPFADAVSEYEVSADSAPLEVGQSGRPFAGARD